MSRRPGCRGRRSARAGFTLLESLMGVIVLSIMVASFVSALSSMLRYQATNDTLAEVQGQGERALNAIVADLRLSGFVSANGVDYPYLFEGGEPDPAFEAHAHVPAGKVALATDADFGQNREIVFALPADDDGDGVPDLDGESRLVWDNREFSYVVVTGADGVNLLQRRVDGGNARVVARYVERVAFDDTNTSGAEVPLGAVRARIWIRLPDRSGLVFRHAVEVTVNLRNG